MNEKRVWIITAATADSEHYITTIMRNFTSESDARTWLSHWRNGNEQELEGDLPSYCNSVSGAIKKQNPEWFSASDSRAESTADKIIESGGHYRGELDYIDIDPDDYSDAKRAYTVEVEVQRSWCFTVEVDSAESQSDAEDQARDQIRDGDEEYQMDCPDDEDITIDNCYET